MAEMLVLSGGPAAMGNLESLAILWMSYTERSISSVPLQAGVAALVPTREEASALFSAGMSEHVVAYVQDQMQTLLQETHIPAFWYQMGSCSNAVAARDDAALGHCLHHALKMLRTAVDEQCTTLSHLAERLMEPCAQHDHHAAASIFSNYCSSHSSGSSSNPVTLAPALLNLVPRHRTCVSAMLMATATVSISGLLRRYYGCKIDQLGKAMATFEDESDQHATLFAGGRSSSAVASDRDADADDVDGVMADSIGQENIAPGAAGHPRPCNLAVDDAAEHLAGHLSVGWANQMRDVTTFLHQLGLGAVAEEAYTSAVNHDVQRQMTVMANTGEFDKEVLPRAASYLNWVPLEFLRLVLSAATSDRSGAPSSSDRLASGADLLLQEWRLRLAYFMYETLGCLRISQMFDIVVDYPDSLPAIHDLAECLQHTSLHTRFIQQFRSSVQQRLLHAGASAADIIHQYISTIRALHEIDPSGSLLLAVGEPIRMYLCSRSDTIHELVTRVTVGSSDEDGGGLSLLEELKGESDSERVGLSSSTSCRPNEDPDEAVLRVAAATVAQGLDPSQLMNGASQRHYGGGGSSCGDIVNMLIAVFGSKDVFINEFRSMLAYKLLYCSDYECAAHIRTTELLKLRFGEGAMHACEVMLKDVADSKRNNTNIRAIETQQQQQQGATGDDKDAAVDPATAEARASLSALISSHLYWPKYDDAKDTSNPEQQLRLPANIVAAMEEYGAKYHSLKSPRKLQWKPHLGVVELEISIGGVTVDFHVAPILATLLTHFNTSEELSASQLAEAVNLPVTLVRQKMLFWVNNGVVEERSVSEGGRMGSSSATVYCRPSHLDPKLHGTVLTDVGAEDEVPATVASGAQEAVIDEMRPYENYIYGMLTNYRGLPLDRLHSMLGRFVISPKYDKSVEQLSAFLSYLLGQEKVQVDNGVYRMKAAAPSKPEQNAEN